MPEYNPPNQELPKIDDSAEAGFQLHPRRSAPSCSAFVRYRVYIDKVTDGGDIALRNTAKDYPHLTATVRT